MRGRTALAVVAGLLLLPSRQHAQPGAPPPPTESSAPSRIDARALLVGAHPDDEDTQLITWLVRGRGVNTAYLSLTRGDGGQNLIGNELGEALGVIRTQELLAARRIDGAHQFFTRAYDFGFSKSAAETFSHWPKEELLGDVVKVVRAFRPHVVIALFQERGGHGQHQVSAILAREAYDLAADTVRFPVGEFGQPWTPLKFYRTARFAPALATLRINVGEFNPALGASYAEIAAESRSQHKSQGFGMLRRLGVVWDYITLEHARTSPAALPGVERSIFDGLSIAPRAISPDSAQAEELRRTVAFQAVADRQTAAAGEAVRVTKTIYNRGRAPITLLTTGTRPDSGSRRILPDSSYQWVESIVAGEITQPWWLSAPRTGDLFTPRIGTASEDARAKTSWVKAEVVPNSPGRSVILSTPIAFHYVDPVRGDVQRPLVVAPGLSVIFDRTIEIARSSTPLDRFINVTLRSAFNDTTSASVSLELPGTLRVDSARRTATLARGATRTFTFRVRGVLPRGTHEIRAVAEAQGRQFRSGYVPVEYEHIEPDRIYRPAALTIRSIDVALSPRLSVAYIQGVGDNVAPMLQQLGVPVSLLNPVDIPAADLSRFSTIVVGPRAYEASNALATNNNHLLAYVRNGGRLVVQYGQYEMMRPGVMPYPIVIRRPHDRVTEENAAVSILDPRSPLLTSPNRIGAGDFSGWIQERALYIPFTFDTRYSAPLGMTDPGEDPKRGALLFAAYGRGTYVYVPLALFRQIPAGVPGAVRIFANLLAGGTQ
ncbi:MAG TPA: PIG-L family deacetylase [Gemmatimonadaceae bacterium]|nr:PIG-L family deacetylase [Gemmatimonadaceae bacterium]